MIEFFIALPIGAVIGWIVREIVSDRLARDRALEAIKITEFNKAAAEFRVAFIKEQRLLDPHSFADRVGLSGSDIIKAAIERHERAMIRFEPFICKAKIEEYKKAWKDYAGGSKHFEQYDGSDMFESQEKRAIALSRIIALLKFSKPIINLK